MLSVVLATHNEEKNLNACLSAIKSLADEIIVVDGASTDKTTSIAKEFGAKIIETTNKQNFHINKQMAIEAASSEYILQLDADEVVDGELNNWLKKVVDGELVLNYSAWWIKRKNFFLGRFLSKGGQYPDKVIRFFKKGKAHLPAKDVHEQMVVDGKIGDADGHLLHYSNPTFADYCSKFNTYTSFRAKQWLETNKNPFNPITFFNYFLWQPIKTFFLIYFRHRGYVDGFPGFVFALMSGLHFSVAYLKLIELKDNK